MTNTKTHTKDWYSTYYREKGADRNDVLRNPEVLYQHLAFHESVVRTLRAATDLDRATASVLDVGCGSCGSLVTFLQLGFLPNNLHGIDIIEERIAEGRARYSNLMLTCDNAAAMSFPSDSFDVVTESTMFVQLTDEVLATSIADEMIRVCKPGGYLLLIDWRYGKPGNRAYRALSRSRIDSLFRVGTASRFVCAYRGALVPPLGRFLSSRLPSFYFLVRALVPALAGSTTTLLQRTS